MEENFNIDGLFREGLNEYAEQAPVSVWERLESDLKKSNTKPVIPLFVKVAAAVALLIGISGITYIFTTRDKAPNIPVITQESVSPNTYTEQRSSGELARAKGKEFKNETELNKVQSHKASSGSAKAAESYTMLAQNNPNTSFDEIRKAESRAYLLPSNTSESFDLRIEVPSDEVYNDFILQQNVLALEAEQQAALQEAKAWAIGGQAGPQYSYRDASINPSGREQFTNYDSFEEGVVAFAGGVNVEMQSKKRWSFQSGIHYSKIGVETSNIIIEANGTLTSIGDVTISDRFLQTDNGLEAPVSTGDISFDQNDRKIFENTTEPVSSVQVNYIPGSVRIEQNFEFVEIPLLVKYRLIDRKFGVNLSGGIWTNFLVGNTATATDSQGYYEEGATNNINTVNYVGSFGVGFNYPVSPKLLITLDPLFKYYLSPLNNDSETEAHPYTFGLMTGLSYYF